MCILVSSIILFLPKLQGKYFRLPMGIMLRIWKLKNVSIAWFHFIYLVKYEALSAVSLDSDAGSIGTDNGGRAAGSAGLEVEIMEIDSDLTLESD